MSKNKQFAVLGLGRFGQSIAKTLAENGCDVYGFDKDKAAVDCMAKYLSMAAQCDVTDPNAIEQIGLNNFDIVVIAIGENMESSIMATLMAKEMGVNYVIAKAKNNMQKTILEKIGADKVVLPERDMGLRIAMNLITTNVIDFINLSDKFGIAEISPIPEWVGKSLQKSDIRAKGGLNVVAIKRDGNVIVSPRANEIIFEADILVVVGESKDIQKVTDHKK